MQENSKVWKVAIYVRLSKEDGDKEESDSISNQKDLIKNYLQSIPNVDIVAEKADDGYSGSNFQRPAFISMIEEIRAGKIDCVVVKDLSRFGRNFTETGRYLENVFPFMGVRFIAINDGIDSTNKKTQSDSIIIPFKNLVNDAYCRDISIKIRSQLEIKRKKGDFIGAFAVYGYLKDEKSKNKLVADKYAASIVENIFKWKLEGMSQQSIADRLNDFGVLSPMEHKRSIGLNFNSGFKINPRAQWSAVAVGRILKDEIYTGVLAQGKRSRPNHKVKKDMPKPESEWIRAYDTHEPIINKDDFELVKQLLTKDTRVARGEATVYMFSGLLRCSGCSNSLIRKTVPSKNKKYYYYVCSNGCSHKRIAEHMLMDGVTSSLRLQIKNIMNIEQILSFIDTLPLKQEEVQRLDKQIQMLQSEIEKYRSLKVSLYESLMDGIIDQEEYVYLKDEYTKRCDEAEQSTFKLNGEIERLINSKGEKSPWIEHFKQHNNFTELDRKIVVSLIDEIVVEGSDRIDIRYKYSYNFSSTLSFIRAVNDMLPNTEFSTTDTPDAQPGVM